MQNDGNLNWSYASTAEYDVPANGRVPITVNWTVSGQFLEVSDKADGAFRAYSQSSFF